MPRFCFIFNPHSGFNRHKPGFIRKVREWIAAEHLDSEFVATERPHHATELARAAVARGCERIIAIGGDGTLNEVAAGVAHTPAAMGLVPCGSGNGLGRHLGVHGSWRRALQIVRDGRVRPIDTGLAAGHRFCNVMGVGFDAEIARRFNSLPTRGLRTYVSTGWNAFFGYQPETYTVRTADGRANAVTAFLLSVANSDQYGNNARIAPGARVDDGSFDLVAIPPVGMWRAAGLVRRLFTGDVRRARGVYSAQGSTFTIVRTAAGVIHVDGETRQAGTEIEVQIEPRSLNFIVPAR